MHYATIYAILIIYSEYKGFEIIADPMKTRKKGEQKESTDDPSHS